MNYLAIGLVIIIIIILYYFYYYFTNTTLTSGLQSLNAPMTVTYDKLKKPNSLTYSYQCWLYISTPTSDSKRIFYRGTPDMSSNFEVDINGQQLVLKAGTGAVNVSATQIMSITNNFPIQKWCYLVINVYNLTTYEAYINGKLAKTINISSNSSVTPSSNTTSLYIGNTGLNGYVTKFTHTPNTLDAKTIWTNYLSGNGLGNFFSSWIPYGLNMSISKGEDVQRSMKIL